MGTLPWLRCYAEQAIRIGMEQDGSGAACGDEARWGTGASSCTVYVMSLYFVDYERRGPRLVGLAG